MNVRIKNKIVVIEFESSKDGFGHSSVMAEIIRLLDEGIKRFVFDFKWVEIAFNSGICGFIVATAGKIVMSGATVTISHVSERDKETLKIVGLDSFGDKIMYN